MAHNLTIQHKNKVIIQLLIKSLGFLYGFYADTHDANMRDIVRTLKSTGSLILLPFAKKPCHQSLIENTAQTSNIEIMLKDKYDINEFFRSTSQPINISACR